MLRRQPATEHIVRVRHDLDAGTAQIGVEIPCAEEQRFARLEVDQVKQQGRDHPRIAGVPLAQRRSHGSHTGATKAAASAAGRVRRYSSSGPRHRHPRTPRGVADRIECRCVDRRQDVERRHRVTEPAECMEIRQRTMSSGLWNRSRKLRLGASIGMPQRRAYPASACGTDGCACNDNGAAAARTLKERQ